MGLTAEEVVNLFEKDPAARKRLAELLVAEPDIRLAIINAVLRDVATKSDIQELRKELKGDISDLRKEIVTLSNATKSDIEALRRELKGDISDLRKEMVALNTATKNDINELRKELKGDIESLRKEISSNFRWTIGVIITVWGATVIPILLKLVGLL